MNILIREAALTDLDNIFDIEKSCFAIPWSKESLKLMLCDNKSYTVLSYDADTVIGFANYMLMYDEVNITNLAVKNEYRNCGVGNALLNALLDEAKAKGFYLITLEVRASNTPAIRLYKKNDFVTEGIRKNYYCDNGEDALIMWNRKGK